MSAKTGRYVVQTRSNGLDAIVSEHPTFSEAEIYKAALGIKGVHADTFIVDRSRNTVAEVADDTELDAIERRIELQKKRAELLALTTSNDAVEKTVNAGQAV